MIERERIQAEPERTGEGAAGNLHELAGGRSGILKPAEDVLEIEGAAEAESDGHTHAWLFRSDVSARPVDLAELPALVAVDENIVWIDLRDFSRRDLGHVANLVKLDSVAVETAQDVWQRPQLHMFPAQFFVSVTVPRLDPVAQQVHASQLDLFVGHNYLVTAHKSDLPFADRIMARAAHNPELVRHDSAFMLYLILDELLAYYEDLSHEINAEVERMEERALQDLSEQFLGDLLHFKRYLYALNALVEQHRPVLRAFLRPDFPFVSGDGVDVYFRDLENRLEYLLGALGASRDAVNNAFDIYVSHVSFRTNQVIKLLTMVSTVLLPISVVVGLFTTSFTGMPLLYSRAGFVVMLVAVALVLVIAFTVFYRLRWIGRSHDDTRSLGPATTTARNRSEH